MYYILGIIVLIALYIGIGIVSSLKVRLYQTDVQTGFTLTIGQLTDMHINDEFDSSMYQDSIQNLHDQNPDVILFTGDLFQTDDITETLEEEVTTFMSNLNATYKFAVLGNHDYHTDGKVTIVTRILENAGFTVLINEAIDITVHDQLIHIIGLDDLRFGNSNYEEVLSTSVGYEHVLVVTHEPDSFADIQLYDVDVVLAGHSHGGQIRFPFIGSLVNVPGAKEYDERFYEENNTKLYISFGSGESVIPLRIYDPRRVEIYHFS